MSMDNQQVRDQLLKYLAKKGGSTEIVDLHVQGKIRGFAHQAFSELMEGLTADQLVTFDEGIFRLTEKGANYCNTLPS